MDELNFDERLQPPDSGDKAVKVGTLIARYKYCDECQQHLEAVANSFMVAESDTARRKLELPSKSLREIELSATSGCHLCSLKCYNWWICQRLWHSRPGLRTNVENSQHSVSKDAEGVFRIATRFSDVTIRVEYYCTPANHFGLEKFVQLDVRHLSQSDKTTDSEPPTTSSSLESMKLPRRWLQECLDFHPYCQTMQQLCNARPSRLLDVSAPCIRLRDRSEIDIDSRYTALSHCWGEAEPLCLTTQNLEKFRQGLRLTDFPALFQDAINVTRKLQCQFLWIDSLCILQDMKDDWTHEFADMGDIFLGATCTIAAISAPDANSRLFEERNPLCFTDCLYTSTDGETHLRICHPIQPRILDRWSGSMKDVRPLLRRGWVVQERYLSSRILAFGNGTVEWSCTSRMASENQDADHKVVSVFAGSLLDFHGDLENGYDDLFGKSSFLATWHRLVEEYSSCAMTFSTDRVPAITGLINVIQRRTRQDNCCGIWCSFILVELLWRVKGESQKQIKNCQPSWSWTSLEGAVEWTDDHGLPKPYIIEAEFIYLIRPLARLQNRAELGIRARLKRMCVEQDKLRANLDYGTAASPDIWMLLIGFETLLLGSHEAIGLLVEPVLGLTDRWRRVGFFTSSTCFEPIFAESPALQLVRLI